jgi:hypothetical protein
MHETEDDLQTLQRVIDESYRFAGAHLLAVHEPDRRLDAHAVTTALTGMRLLVLATTDASGRPVTGAVDGIFYRGRFHFGTARESVRYRHLRHRPAVSATHLPGEHLAITVHGVAEPIDVHADEHAAFRRTLLDLYVPRYGESWASMLDDAVYLRIEPRRVFTFSMPDEA